METNDSKRIDGKLLAQEVLASLKPRIAALKKKKIVPTLAVIQVGDDQASTSYIRMKKDTAKRVGAHVIVKNFPNSVFFQQLAEAIHAYNADPNVHGIIIQRPLPPMLSTNAFNTAIKLEKDVDGFRPKSIFRPPIALIVFNILRHVYDLKNVTSHLKNKLIVIVGRGETAGKPIADMLSEKKVPFILAHSQTVNIREFTQEADIVISCVGHAHTITADMVKEGVILIGIGIQRSDNGKLVGDYNEKEIAPKASFYTPTPGGTGPLNVAYLMSNLVTAAEKAK